MKRIQDLRDRVVLLKRRVQEESDGNFTETWEEIDSVWAHVSTIQAREVLGEGWNASIPIQKKYKVVIRYRHGHFERVRWHKNSLAMLCAPMFDQRRQWTTCFMYEVEDQNE